MEQVDGHGSVTYLLFRNGTLLAGDNSGYLRSYDISVAGGNPLQQIRTHTDRVTAIDAFTFALAEDDHHHASSSQDGGKGGRPPRASSGDARWGTGGGVFGGGRQRWWDQGHGWGEGWEVEEEGEGEEATPAASAAAAVVANTMAEAAAAGCGRGHGVRLRCGGGGGGGGGSGGGSGGVGGVGGGGGGGSEMAFGVGELASLGKRQAYAGRGQGDRAPDAEAGGHELGRGGSSLGSEAVARRDEEEEEEEEGRAVLITGSDDGTAKAWDAASGRFVCMYAGHTRGVTCLQATSTESYGPVLVTGGGDSAIIIWEV
ncbi:unnamed protein product, partial [Laminaria digitata]